MALALVLAAAFGVTFTSSAPRAHAIIDGTESHSLDGQVQFWINHDFVCTGTLIDVSWVLTAEHCLTEHHDPDPDVISVLVGDRRLSAGTAYFVSEYFKSPDSDAALLHLRSPVTQANMVVGYGLSAPPNNDHVAIRGWGATDPDGGSDPSPVLKVATLRVGDNSADYPDAPPGATMELEDASAGIPSFGDSGAGIYYEGRVYGVLAGGDQASYAVAVKTDHLRDWIVQTSGVQPWPPPSFGDLRVMPLGDSITYGVASSTGNGYRQPLRDSLVNAGAASVDLVGSVRSGTMADNDNEGHPGKRIDQVADFAACSVPSSRPNVVLLHAGTNDMNQAYELDQAPARTGALIDEIIADAPETTVIVATLIPATKEGLQPRIDAFNAALPALVEARRAQGAHVELADMSAVTTADLAEPAHPSDTGYAKMATAFVDAMVRADDQDWIQKPQPGNGQACTADEDDSDDSAAGPGWRALGVIAPGMSTPEGRTDLVELNGDDRADYVRIAADGSVRAALNTPGDVAGQPHWADQGLVIGSPQDTPDAGDQVRFADLDGNGVDDYLLLGDDSSVRAWYLSGDGTFELNYAGVVAPGISGATGAAIRFADVDGDGRDDYLRTGADGSVHAYINTPVDGGNAIHWVEHLDWAPGVWYGSRDKLRLADVNGDRRADYLMVGSTGTVHAYFNDGGGGGGGFTEHLDFVRETGYPGDKSTFRDISGDGRADYVVIYDGGSIRCWLNTGGNV
jgi:lysophospholipase L1-like esterase